jgi:cellulose synthase (UDP-forming)
MPPANKRKLPIMLFIITSLLFIIGMGYVTWRWVFTLNLLTSPVTTFWSYALLAAEILTFLVFTNFCLILAKADKREKIVIDNKLQQDYCKDAYHKGELVTFKNFCPSVDVFVCTINESADMLSTTISACKNIDYPNKKVYVLDDGKRPEIKKLTDLLGCKYLTRDTNKGHKAGNINNALSQTDSDIVVIFDADHVPASTFLRETIYHFLDEKIALIQTPQHFCNPDAFQKNLRMEKFLSNEQEMFYRVIEPSLNEYGSVFCGGTNILIRRKHLDAVGDFPETTITEDSLLGLKLHSAGYKIFYYNRPIAIGLAASSIDDYIKQRSRWAKGNIQIVTNPQNWEYYAKLKPMQAFLYVSGVLYFFTPIARIIFLLAPVLFLLFDISPMLVIFYQIFAFQLCYFTLKFAFLFTKVTKIRNLIFADVYDLVTSIFTIGSIFKTVFIPEKLLKTKFTVTKKDFKTPAKTTKYIVTLLALFALLTIAELEGMFNLLYSDVDIAWAIAANLFWNSLNLIVLIFAIKVVIEKPEKRTYQRVKVEDDLIIEDEKRNRFKTHIFDSSRSGLSFVATQNFTERVDKDFQIDISGEQTPLNVLSCQKQTPEFGKEKEQYFCKASFKEPISLTDISSQFVDRLDKYVKFAYKNPDEWDDYFDDD